LRLSNLCTLLGLVWLLLGVAAGLVAQAELAAPGVDVFSFEALVWFTHASRAHGVILLISLPLTAVAGAGFALLTERGGGRVWAGVSMACIAGSVLLAAVQIVASLSSILVARDAAALVLAATLTLCGAATLANAVPKGPAHRSVRLYAGAGILALIGAAGVWTLVRGLTPSLRDSWVTTAAIHAVGVGLTLMLFAMLHRWMESHARPGRAWLSSLHAAGLLATGAAMSLANVQLGLSGMPRGYADYPESLTEGHLYAMTAGILFITLVLAGIARIALMGRQGRDDAVEDTFA